LTANVVYLNQGWDSQQFTALADGTYAPERGSVAILDAPSGSFRLRTKDGVTMIFNSSGQISSWASAAGATVSFSYTGGLLTTVSNAATGRQLTLGYSGGLVSSVTDGTRTVSYTYTNNVLTAFADALQQNTTYSYDTSGQYDTAGHLTQIFYPSHPNNAFVTTSYDALGNVMQQMDAIGNLTHTYFAGTRSESDDAVGNREVWYFDPYIDMTAHIRDYGPAPHLNITSLYTYDSQMNMLTATMPEGNSTVYTYDALFNPLTITNNPKPGSNLASLPQTLTYTTPVASLPNFEEVQTASDPEGNVTTNSYSAATGTLSSMAQPAVPKPGGAVSSPTWTYTYTAIGLPQKTTDPEGRVRYFAYDPTFGDQVMTQTTDYGRLNLATSFTYDTVGNLATLTDANGHTTSNTFDNLRRLVEIDGAIAGVVTKYTYFPDGQIQTIAKQLTPGVYETTTHSYTLEDQVSTVTDALGNTVTTTYDANNRKHTVTAQVSATQSRQRTYTYDALSRLYQVADTTTAPGTPLETYTYSANSNQVGFSDANGRQIANAYDGFDRLMQTTYPDTTSEQYAYNPDGAPVQRTVRSGQTIAFTYDALNRLATKTPAAETAGQVTYGYDYSGRLLQAADQSSITPYQIAYDTSGRPLSFTDQQGRATQVQYDGVGNRTRLQWPAAVNGGSAYFVSYAYDPLNRMTEIDANGSLATPLAKYQWDALSRPTLIAHGDGTTDSYAQYDASDNLLALTESFNGGSGVTFQYGWLKNHQRQSTAVSNTAFQYLPATGALTYAAADVDEGYTGINAVNLNYDGNHNLTYDGANSLTYDVENRLIQAQNTLSGTSQYFYDPMGHRKQKVVAGLTTQFLLAGDEEIADYSGAGAGTAQSLTVRGVAGLPVASVTVSSGAVAYYHHDALGSTVALTQSGTSGAAETVTYSEFGMPASGGGAQYLFSGYRFDAETGLYYVRARYYSSQLGRFLQTDPIGTRGGGNLYAYAGNDPINRTDRMGTSPDRPQVLEASMGPIGPGYIFVRGVGWVWSKAAGAAAVPIESASGAIEPIGAMLESSVSFTPEAAAILSAPSAEALAMTGGVTAYMTLEVAPGVVTTAGAGTVYLAAAGATPEVIATATAGGSVLVAAETGVGVATADVIVLDWAWLALLIL
jgi:RHS repeat-associated protein